MQVSVKRIDPSLPLPRHETGGSVGFDLITRIDTLIEPGQIGLVPSNVIVQVPKGHALLILPRSSLPRKKGLVCPHSLGVIDEDYHGPEDEIFVQVQNITSDPVVIKRGERIAQGLIVKVEKAQWAEVVSHEAKTRGGFGSTG
ncbi:MAG: dUTP diphosphatase [Candidatus Peribacteraceae bacterium]|jgi:dUTP pyrophosphatase|nr:dUTP diphosphatase [Candidatus Peribacteraceae bacterium]MDP7454462.1 dUTP diphosphatase [Candidatus Peribacteraceae bacterium]MDP7645943.1 dUTP diphosphatase [Candidatus Peribacteraceae bacterium]|tara:strand:+ start:254 stop:682 length:429 start_codon:yes stop_codon:yes gene_type:complete